MRVLILVVWLVSMNPGHATVQAPSTPSCDPIQGCVRHLLIPSSIGNGPQLPFRADSPSARRRQGAVSKSEKTGSRQLEGPRRAHARDAQHGARGQRLVPQMRAWAAARPALPLLLGVLQLLQLEYVRVRRVRRHCRSCRGRSVGVRSRRRGRRVGRRESAKCLRVEGPSAVAEPTGAKDLDLRVWSNDKR